MQIYNGDNLNSSIYLTTRKNFIIPPPPPPSYYLKHTSFLVLYESENER